MAKQLSTSINWRSTAIWLLKVYSMWLCPILFLLKGPIPLIVPPAPVPPNENGEDYYTKLTSYQKSFQVYAQARSFNNESEAKYLKLKQDNDKALSLLKNCFRPAENKLVFSRSAPPQTVNEALTHSETLFKATELSGNDLISWFKQLIKLKLVRKTDCQTIYVRVQSLATNANLYREISKREMIENDLEGNPLTEDVKNLVNDLLMANDEKWSLLFFTSQYLESPPDSPFFNELTSKLTTTGFGKFKTLQEFVDEIMNLSQSMITSNGVDVEQNDTRLNVSKKRFQPRSYDKDRRVNFKQEEKNDSNFQSRSYEKDRRVNFKQGERMILIGVQFVVDTTKRVKNARKKRIL